MVNLWLVGHLWLNDADETKCSVFVSVDCWDGSGDDPVVYHGHTLTSKILFRDVLDTIDEYAFEKSP